MTKQQLIQSIKQALVTELHLEGVAVADINDTDPLFGEEGLQLDSLDAVELVVLIEKHYGIALSDVEEARGAFQSVSVLADFIMQHPSVTLP